MIDRNEPLGSDGVNRRSVLCLPIGMAAAIGLRRFGRDFPREDDFARFAERWTKLFDGLNAESALHEEAYLHELTAALAGVPRRAFPERMKVSYERDGLKSGPGWAKGSIFIVDVSLGPGAVIPAHNHVGYCNVSLGLEGGCEVRHYEPKDVAPEAKSGTETFLVRETKRIWLAPGRVSDLRCDRDNIHAFRAGPEGARLLDFTTRLENPGRGYQSFSALEVQEEPEDGFYPARWIGNPFK
ncbi:MAG: hypothetical protein RL885_08675 [Planctomycetota bacterium]